jgi:hypothetical protein
LRLLSEKNEKEFKDVFKGVNYGENESHDETIERSEVQNDLPEGGNVCIFAKIFEQAMEEKRLKECGLSKDKINSGLNDKIVSSAINIIDIQ